MEGLVAYSDSDDSGSEHDPSSPDNKGPMQQQQQQQQQRPSTVAAKSAPPPPQLDALPDASMLLGGGDEVPLILPRPAAGKRGLAAAQGPAGPAGPKPQRSGARLRPGQVSPPSAVLLPPQLRGRSNVVTEDLDKMGLSNKKKKQAGRQQ